MMRRISPVAIGLEAERVLARSGWEIPLAYIGERTKTATFVTDLSHVPKWIIQGADLDSAHPGGLSMPAKPGMITLDRGLLLVRTLPSECRIMALGDEVPEFTETNCTEVTDGYAALAVVGPQCFDVLSKLCSVDMEGKSFAGATLAPVEELTCLLVRIEGADGVPGIILAGARGYGHFLVDALLDAGREYTVRPAGWERFSRWIAGASVAAEPPIESLTAAKK